MPLEEPTLPAPIESTLRFALQHRPWTVVFYSFRGGVGRTTALLSTAQLLTIAQNETSRIADGSFEVRSKRPKIAIIDFDLEAPGIDAFPSLMPDDPNQPGLVEYLDAWTSNAETPPDIRHFVYKRRFAESEILIMRAGRQDEAYRKALGRLNLEHLYRFENGELLFENLRAGLKQEFECELLLVDSRTGTTEIGGVCLGHLADACVLVFQPTKAHMKGLPEVVDQLKKRSSTDGREIPFVFLSSKTPQANKNQFDPASISLAKSLIGACNIACDEIVVHEDVNASLPDIPQPGDSEFFRISHLVFVPTKGNTNIHGSFADPESYLIDDVSPFATEMSFAFLFLANYCFDSQLQALQIELDEEEMLKYQLLVRKYERHPSDSKLSALLHNKWGCYWLRTLSAKQIDVLPIEHQVRVLKLKQNEV